MTTKKVIREMHGVKWNDPRCCHSPKELICLIEKIGFLPLFRNEIEGFSVEEYTMENYWWTKDEKNDPWLWRVDIARSGRVAYGKFFQKKAGFISKEWFPYFANLRRKGYDFDSLYEDGGAKQRCKKIMNLFENQKLISSIAMKKDAGFKKGGEKNFNGILAELQMQMYLTIQDFHRKKNKCGEEYGMYVSYYDTPEQLWGYKYVTSGYKELPEISRQRAEQFMMKMYSKCSLKAINKYLCN